MDEVSGSWAGIDPPTADDACVNTSDQQSDLCNRIVTPTDHNVDGRVFADASKELMLLPGRGLRVEIADQTPPLSGQEQLGGMCKRVPEISPSLALLLENPPTNKKTSVINPDDFAEIDLAISGFWPAMFVALGASTQTARAAGVLGDVAFSLSIAGVNRGTVAPTLQQVPPQLAGPPIRPVRFMGPVDEVVDVAVTPRTSPLRIGGSAADAANAPPTPATATSWWKQALNTPLWSASSDVGSGRLGQVGAVGDLSSKPSFGSGRAQQGDSSFSKHGTAYTDETLTNYDPGHVNFSINGAKRLGFGGEKTVYEYDARTAIGILHDNTRPETLAYEKYSNGSIRKEGIKTVPMSHPFLVVDESSGEKTPGVLYKKFNVCNRDFMEVKNASNIYISDKKLFLEHVDSNVISQLEEIREIMHTGWANKDGKMFVIGDFQFLIGDKELGSPVVVSDARKYTDDPNSDCRIPISYLNAKWESADFTIREINRFYKAHK
jgi:hypothetical protein